MLELTDAARQQLHDSLNARETAAQEGKCFRIVPKDDRFLTLTIARPAQSDAVIEHEGDAILALPKALEPFFKDKSLDIDNTGKLTVS